MLQFLFNVLSLVPESHSGHHPAFCHHVSWGSSWLWHFLRLSLLMTLTAEGALGGHLIECPSVWVCLLFPRVLLTWLLWVSERLLRQVLTLGSSLSNLTHVCADLSSFLCRYRMFYPKEIQLESDGVALPSQIILQRMDSIAALNVPLKSMRWLHVITSFMNKFKCLSS